MVIHPLQLIKLIVHFGYTISRQLLTVHVGIQNHAPLLPGICNTSQFLWLLPLLLAPLATSHPRASSIYDGLNLQDYLLRLKLRVPNCSISKGRVTLPARL